MASCGSSCGTPSSSYGAVAPFGGNYGSNFAGYPFGSNFGTGFGSNMAAPFGGNFGGNFGSHAVTPFGGASNWAAPFFGGNNNNFDRSFNRMFRDLEKTFSSELNLQPSRPASMLEHYSLTNPIRYDADGNRSLNCYFDMRSFKPEEVTVTLDSKNRTINVEAVHEVKDKEHYIKRNYSRKVYIPEELKVDLTKIDLKSCLTNEGLLCVEAALPKLSLEEARATAACTKSISSAVEPNVYKVATKTI
jgi:HSP20 family molecular chaperone IbpA